MLTAPFPPQMDAEAKDSHLIFFKLRPDAVTPDNMTHTLLVSSLVASPAESFYHAVQKLYAPLLLREDKRFVDPKLQSLLTDLEAGLGSSLRSGASRSRSGEPDERSCAAILTPADEFAFWAEQAGRGGRDARSRADHFLGLLQPMIREVGGLDALPSLAEAVDVLETCQDALDDLWKQAEVQPAYPEQRMRHFMEVLGAFEAGRGRARQVGVTGQSSDLQGTSLCASSSGRWPT